MGYGTLNRDNRNFKTYGLWEKGTINRDNRKNV